MSRVVLPVFVAALTLLGTAACSPSRRPEPTPTYTPAYPSASAAPPSPRPAEAWPAGPGPRPTTVDAAGVRLRVRIFGRDVVADCRPHAYGFAMVRFLAAHPCPGAHRMLVTATVGRRLAAVSVVAIDRYGGSDLDGQLVALLLQRPTDGINDLVRDGLRIRGVAEAVPAEEAFAVTPTPDGAVVSHAWWVHGRTQRQDPRLLLLAERLTTSRAAFAT